MERWYDAWYNRYAAMVLPGVLGVIAYQEISWHELSRSDWGTWIGAIGTFCAFAGTIWIATGERRERVRQERDHAMMVAGAMTFRISGIMAAIDALGDEIQQKRIKGEMPDYAKFAARIISYEPWSVSELAPLVILPNHAAVKLAICERMISRLMMVLTSCEKQDVLGLEIDAYLLPQISMITKALTEANRQCLAINGGVVVGRG